MESTHSSIENCSICKNSKNKNFFMAPEYYNQIFGYIGPVSKYHLIDLLISKENVSLNKEELKKSTSKLNKIYDLTNDLTNATWMQPDILLYNLKSHRNDRSKMRYDESDTDFDDLRNKNKNKSEEEEDESDSYGNICLSDDSIAGSSKKKMPQKTDPEDIHPLNFFKKSNNKSIKSSMKEKLKDINLDFSIDSTNTINNSPRKNVNNSVSSMKLKNLKSVVKDLFGSIESLKARKNTRKYNVSKPIDSEDMQPTIIKNCIEFKKPAGAFTNSDFSLNSDDRAKDSDKNRKKKKNSAYDDTSISSGALNVPANLEKGGYGSIESIKYLKKRKKRPNTVDREDELASINCRNMWTNKKPRKKSSRGKSGIPVKKKKKITPSKCYICTDLPKSPFS